MSVRTNTLRYPIWVLLAAFSPWVFTAITRDELHFQQAY
jgi:hypothetical protein